MNPIERARVIAQMGETQGWQLFKEDIEQMIKVSTPDVELFEAGDAVKIASKVIFANGLRRALRVMEQQTKISAQQ